MRRALSAALEYFTRGLDMLCRIGMALSAAALVAILMLVCAEVVARSVFDSSTLIADEMGGYLNAAVLYLGMPWALKSGAFIRVDFLYGRLRGAAKVAADWFMVLTSLGCTLVIGYYVVDYVHYAYVNRIVSLQITRTPMFIPQSTMIFGFVVMALQLVSYALQRVRNVP